jgi:hypothetical protein
MEPVDEIIKVFNDIRGRNYFSVSTIEKLNKLAGDPLFFKTILNKSREIQKTLYKERTTDLFDKLISFFDEKRQLHSVNWAIRHTEGAFSRYEVFEPSIILDRFNDYVYAGDKQTDLDFYFNRRVKLIDKSYDVTIQICIYIMEIIKERFRISDIKLDYLKKEESETPKKDFWRKLQIKDLQKRPIVKNVNKVNLYLMVDHSIFKEALEPMGLNHYWDHILEEDRGFDNYQTSKIGNELSSFISSISKLNLKFERYADRSYFTRQYSVAGCFALKLI